MDDGLLPKNVAHKVLFLVEMEWVRFIAALKLSAFQTRLSFSRLKKDSFSFETAEIYYYILKMYITDLQEEDLEISIKVSYLG